MDVGLEDVGEPDVVLGQQVEHAVDVALRVDDEGDLAVVDEVAAVAERRGLDRDDRQVVSEGALGHDAQPFLIGRPERIQASGAAGDVDGVEALRSEHVGHRGAAVARGADDVDDRRVVELAEAAGQVTHGDIARAGHVALGVLAGLAHVHDYGAAVDRCGELVDVDLTHG